MPEFDQLEVLYFHKPGSDKEKSLEALQQAVQESFTVEGRAFVDDGPFSRSRQIVRLQSSRLYSSAQEIEDHARVLAPEDQFPWARIGVVRVGQSMSVLA